MEHLHGGVLSELDNLSSKVTTPQIVGQHPECGAGGEAVLGSSRHGEDGGGGGVDMGGRYRRKVEDGWLEGLVWRRKVCC